MKLLTRLTALTLCVCTLLAGAGCGRQSGGENAVLRLALDDMPHNLDPQLAESDETRLIARSCFEGLFRMDQGDVVPAACESCDVSADGLTYTLTLRKGLAWSDGEPVTAADFRFGLIRALRPETAAPEAGLLRRIEGAEAMLAGQGGEAAVGVTARDARTLVIRLTEPDARLPETLTYAMAMPCREDVFTAAGGRYGMSADKMVCNGPLTVAQWGETSLRLIRNEHYVGPFAARSAGVTLSFGDSDAARIDTIRDGLTDLAVLRAQSVAAAEAAHLTVFRRADVVWVLWIRPDAPTVGDPAVSAALKLALGSEVTEAALPAGFTASDRLLADDLRVGRRRAADVLPAPGASPFDPGAAQTALVEALKPYKGALPTMTLRYADEEGIKAVAGSVARQWQQALGAVVNIEPMAAGDLTAGVENGQIDLALLPLTADDGQAISSLTRLAGWLADGALRAEMEDADPEDGAYAQKLAEWEQALLADCHVYPVAQSGRCLAASGDVTGVDFDLQQGSPPLYKLGK